VARRPLALRLRLRVRALDDARRRLLAMDFRLPPLRLAVRDDAPGRLRLADFIRLVAIM
jgi:hypothetical protein